jgi:hypothetical protein
MHHVCSCIQVLTYIKVRHKTMLWYLGANAFVSVSMLKECCASSGVMSPTHGGSNLTFLLDSQTHPFFIASVCSECRLCGSKSHYVCMHVCMHANVHSVYTQNHRTNRHDHTLHKSKTRHGTHLMSISCSSNHCRHNASGAQLLVTMIYIHFMCIY